MGIAKLRKILTGRMVSTLTFLIILPFLVASCISDNTNTWSLQFKAEAPFYGISALDSDHVWAVGDKGIYFFDGSVWNKQYSSDYTLLSVDALDANHVWAVGVHADIDFYDGTAWSDSLSFDSEVIKSIPGERLDSSVSGIFHAVTASDENHIWVVGDNGLILFGDGHDWRYQSCDTMECLIDVVANDAEHAWAVSNHDCIYAYTPPEK